MCNGAVIVGAKKAREARKAAPAGAAQEPNADAAVTAGTQREIVARRTMRRYLTRRSPVYWALYLVTLVMELDLWLFGWMRTGPYFVLAEKAEGQYRPAPLPSPDNP